jgi:hypothetical protein
MKLATLQHQWVKHTITPVSTLTDTDGEPIVFVDPDQAVIAEDHAVYGCDRCGEAMAGNHNTECKGEVEE